MASVPKGKRGAAAVVVTSEGQRVEANVLNKQGEIILSARLRVELSIGERRVAPPISHWRQCR